MCSLRDVILLIIEVRKLNEPPRHSVYVREADILDEYLYIREDLC